MPRVTLTEEFILHHTGHHTLATIKHLSLSGLGLKELNCELFQTLTHLEELDLSNNELTGIPDKLCPPGLKTLDISDNKLSSVEFLRQYPELRVLSMENNPNLEPSDKYIAATICRQIEKIDKNNKDSLQKLEFLYKQKAEPVVKSVWEEHFSEHGWDCRPDEMKSLAHQVASKVATLKPYANNSLCKYRDFLVRQLAYELICKVNDGSYQPPVKKKKYMVKPVKHPRQKQVKADASPRKSPKKLSLAAAELPKAPDYDPLHFVRCHFNDRDEKKLCVDNDPKDEFTKVWHCCFEPDPNNNAETTGTVATCGGDCVCLLDCGTGRVMKRFKQEKDQFYCLAWATLELTGEGGEERKTNILAVGGHQGKIKLLHPEQGVSYAEWGNGIPNRKMRGIYYISTLKFHPRENTWLFAGASDASITLWDIGVPQGEKYTTNHKQLLLLFTFEQFDPVLTLVVSAFTDHVVAGCTYGCYVWKLNKADIESTRVHRREPVLELAMPGDEEDPMVDSLVEVTDDIVASKCVKSGCIYLWSLSATVKCKPQRNGEVKVKPLLCLQWINVNTEFISMGTREGMLGCGDNSGNVYLYNIGRLLNKDLNCCDEMYKPSRVIEWPECKITSHRDQERQMTDVLETPEPLVINMVAFSSGLDHLICVTDCNLVCVWNKTK